LLIEMNGMRAKYSSYNSTAGIRSFVALERERDYLRSTSGVA
jgi:hypothetical protein